LLTLILPCAGREGDSLRAAILSGQTFGLAALGINDSGAYAFSNAFNYSISPSAGIPMRRQAIPPAEQQYIAAHPPDADDPT
jgi:hypothetical protein